MRANTQLFTDVANKASSRLLFADVSQEAWGPNPHFLKPDHVGQGANHQATPYFPDLDGDGILDFFYHNHFRSNLHHEWDVGLGCTTEGGTPCFESIRADQILTVTEDPAIYADVPVNCEDPQSPHCFVKDGPFPVDAHGVAFVDIDKDGLLDMYISTGADHGTQSGPVYDSFLAWGDQPVAVDQKSAGKLKQVAHFRGGRDAARKANMHNPGASGRLAYFVDFDPTARRPRLRQPGARERRLDRARRRRRVGAGGRRPRPQEPGQPHVCAADGLCRVRAHDAAHRRRRRRPRQRAAVQRRDACRAPSAPMARTTRRRPLSSARRPCATTAVYKYDHATHTLKLLNPPTARSSTPPPRRPRTRRTRRMTTTRKRRRMRRRRRRRKWNWRKTPPPPTTMRPTAPTRRTRTQMPEDEDADEDAANSTGADSDKYLARRALGS